MSGSEAVLSRSMCEDFIVNEARLLDEGQFDEWLTLFAPEGRYWVPSEPGQASPLDTVSLMYDDRRLLETCVRRLLSPKIYSQEPRSRTSRVVGSITVGASHPGTTKVRSKFVMVEYRRGEQRLFSGTCWHELVTAGSDIRIALKRVDLLNCDAPLDGLAVPF